MSTGLAKAARWTEVAVGLFFLVSATAKAVDMDSFGVQISAYNVVKDAGMVRASAWIALIAEVALGGALLAGTRLQCATHAASGAMILVYSTLITYAWRYHGLTDCGCLGTWIQMGPVESLIKNAVLLGAIGVAWLGQPRAGVTSRGIIARGRKMAAGILTAGVLVIALASVATKPERPGPISGSPRDSSRPFAQFSFLEGSQAYNLGQGEYLVAFLNATCEHCRASVPALNKLVESPGLPQMVALMMGSEEELAEFESLTSPLFSMHLIEPLTFMEFIGTVPPRLSYIHDGVGVRHWDWQDEVPGAEILAYFATARE